MPRVLLAVMALLLAVVASNARVGAEDLTTTDRRLQEALALLDRDPHTRHLHAVLDANRVRLEFVPMASGIYARYSVPRHVVEIDQRWADADVATLAAVITHEATHAEDAVSGYLASGGAGACIESEMRAFHASARFWISQFGAHGKPRASDELEQQLNLIAEREQRDPAGLDELVRQTYTAQCAH
jgi:hypothetical protein